MVEVINTIDGRKFVDDYRKVAEDDGPEEFRKRLNEISPTFCVAKFKQTTMLLQNGHTHSCHHPTTHKVPLEELARSSSALHNTEYKLQMRDQMMKGTRPKECDYCWRVEDANPESYSDRIMKSMTDYGNKYIADIISKDSTHDHAPSYLEVSFGNVCNFKCAYCAPHISSQWMAEIEQHGAYNTSDGFNNLQYLEQVGRMPIPNNQPNPYVDAFWDYFPNIVDELDYFRITGGEPLLNKNTFKVLDYIEENPQPNLRLAINSNLDVPVESFKNFISACQRIEDKVFEIEVYTSAEAYGKAAEYIRFGMDYKRWKDNLIHLMSALPNVRVTVMCTYNLLSMPSFKDYILDMGITKTGFGHRYAPDGHLEKIRDRLHLDFPFLRYPEFITMYLAQGYEPAIAWIDDAIQAAKQMNYSPAEIDNIIRLKNTFVGEQSWSDEYRAIKQKDFITFIEEYDRRRFTNFDNTFPELVHLKESFKTHE